MKVNRKNLMVMDVQMIFEMRLHLYKRPCPLVGWSVCRSVMLLTKSMKNGLLWILNDLDSAGRGK